MIPPPAAIEQADFESQIPQLPNADAVFLVRAGEGSVYIAKTSMLRRRLQRILKAGEGRRRSLNLSGVATRVEYWLTGSRFESMLVHYEVAKQYHPDDYLQLIKLRMPAYVKLILSNEFPRTQVTSRLGGGPSLYYGPFRSRVAAEQFEAQLLDLFQIRRCQEDLVPHPDHPGCIYGEMNMCLRPCQQVVGVEEYRSEVNRVAEFLTENGKSMLQTITAARNRFSEEMEFEEAARQHKRLERVNQVLSLRDDLVSSIDGLFGVAITPSITPDAVKLFFLHRGTWQPGIDFQLISNVSLDQRLRELIAALQNSAPTRQERQEHLALLARWYYSSYRDGEWIQFQSLDRVPYRKLVKGLSRVHGAHVASLESGR